MSNPNKILLGLIGAAAAGVVIGILLAPEKGGEVRQKIADKAGDLCSKIGELITSGKNKASQIGEDIAGNANQFAEKFSNNVHQAD